MAFVNSCFVLLFVASLAMIFHAKMGAGHLVHWTSLQAFEDYLTFSFEFLTCLYETFAGEVMRIQRMTWLQVENSA